MRDAVTSLPDFFPELFTGAATPPGPTAAPLPRELWRYLAWGADYPGVAELWPRWCAVVDDLSDPDVELTVEDFAPALALFNRLERLGVIFDESFARFIRGIEAAGIGGEADGDRDDADALLALEDSDEDRGHDDSSDTGEIEPPTIAA